MSESEGSHLLRDIISANHKFSADLYKVLAKNGDENIFFSPLSIQTALLLLYIGAKGKTQEELASGLHFPKDKTTLLNGVKNILDRLECPALKLATEMFIEKDFKVKDSYKSEASAYLKSSSQLVNFKQEFEAARKLINSWVSGQTNDKINDLLASGTLSSDTRLVLVNAIHFKDVWEKQFDARNTKLEDFFLKEKSVKVPMMFKSAKFPYIEQEGYQALQIPYKTEGFNMLILLPNEIDGLVQLESKLSDINFTDLRSKMTSWNKVDLYLPKFKLEQCFELTKVLTMLGMKSMFSSCADFSALHEPTEEKIAVSSVVHKAFVDVTEEGTEAAAATAMQFVQCSMTLPQIPIIFRVDHSFIFVITQIHSILFIGRLSSAPPATDQQRHLVNDALDLSVNSEI